MLRSFKRRLQRVATEWLALPPDTLLNVSRVTCVDGNEIAVENVETLVRVSETEVELDLGNARLKIQGKDFEVTLVAGSEVHLRGEVRQIEYVRHGGVQK